MVADFVAYLLPVRYIRERCNSNGPWGCRSGSRARGSLTQRMVAPRLVPPAARKVSAHESIQVLGNPPQIGFPASMDTDACLGYSVMAYQRWGVVFDPCGAWKSTIVRLEGRLSKGDEAKAKDGLCQKAKVGCCPRCTQATRVSISPSYTIGVAGPMKQMGVRLWSAFGPWAPRSLAAIDYSTVCINSYPLPRRWDWSATALDVSAPEPMLRGFHGGEPIVIQTIAQTNAANAVCPMLPPPPKGRSKQPPRLRRSPKNRRRRPPRIPRRPLWNRKLRSLLLRNLMEL